jgi:ATP-dependent RNA helicase DDX42
VRSKIDALKAVDHSQMEYEPFRKEFYSESKIVGAMTESEVDLMRARMDLRVNAGGAGAPPVPRPCATFEQMGLDPRLLTAIAKQKYTAPTAIQSQAVPCALMGRDLIGIAKTGSGKTAAFVWPMITHIMDQRELQKGEGPIGLIVAPTRELADQIFTETRKFAKPFNLVVTAVFGGMNKHEQFKALKAGCEVVVSTPVRGLRRGAPGCS